MSSHEPGGGFLLVASPELLDPNFRRTVVLIVTHDTEGAFGLVLNRPLQRSLGELLESDNDRAGRVPLLQGGPVQTDMVQFVSSREDAGRAVVPGVAVGASLEDAAAGDEGQLRAFVGYAGWSGGQLEQETEEGSWIVAPAEARHVFAIPSDDLWVRVLKDLGGAYAWMALVDGRPSEN